MSTKRFDPPESKTPAKVCWRCGAWPACIHVGHKLAVCEKCRASIKQQVAEGVYAYTVFDAQLAKNIFQGRFDEDPRFKEPS